MNDLELNFSEITSMIETGRNDAYKKVNDSNLDDKIVEKLVKR